jgi:uncharacterized protein with PIN domain
VGRRKSEVDSKTFTLDDTARVATSEVEDLREYTLEAEQVELLRQHNGWLIMERDFEQYKKEIGCRLPYLNTKSKEFQEARILFIASDKALKMVEDYIDNRKQALELLHKIENPDKTIVLDVDNG